MWGIIMSGIARLGVQALVPVTILVAVFILFRFGGGEIATREALRGSARIAFVLFLLAFMARPLNDLISTRVTRWLVAERKTIGVSFALSMLVHLGLIVWLFVLSAPTIPEAVTIADFFIGLPVLILVFVMGLTSARALRARMSMQGWGRLHTTGQYLVWLVFVLCLTDSMGRKSPPYPASDYTPFLALLALAMIVRLLAALIGKNGRLRRRAATA